jgi:MFS transporter, putative metabolite:H+ symporter
MSSTSSAGRQQQRARAATSRARIDGPDRLTPRGILARLDRIDVWSMPFIFIAIIGTGFLFAFYDVFDINVSFIQSRVALKHGCTPANAVTALRVPVVLNLAGYVVGALALAPISDRIGRRNMLLFTMLLTGLGSLYNALAPDYTQFVLARVITGIGVGADLAIVNTYLGEVAPRRNRARWISVIFIMSALGALLGIWLGLFLTTSPAPWPHGLSFAQASPSFTDGWRWMYGVGAVLALIGVLLRLELPESARWLVGKGRLDEADRVVNNMESVASKHGRLGPVPDLEAIPVDRTTPDSSWAFGALFGNRTYTKRVIQLLLVWFLAYVTVFGFSAGFTSMLSSLKYPPPEAGLITAVGAFGFLACALFAVKFADRLERKYWLPIGATITVIGGVIVAEAGTNSLAIAFIGSAIVFFGFNIWVPMTYALSTESFPTRARVTGFGLVDGVGHLGGGIGVLLIAPQIPHMSVLGAMLAVSGWLVLAAIVVQFSANTRGRHYEEISP